MGMTDNPIQLTAHEEARLWNLLTGAQHSGAARRKLIEFSEERGWTDADRNHVIASLRERRASEPSKTPCAVCGTPSRYIDRDGRNVCRDHSAVRSYVEEADDLRAAIKAAPIGHQRAGLQRQLSALLAHEKDSPSTG